ncbi:hypothetical protein SAMN05216490_0843 [Mucilaginibacter mallensis]|uniref:Uncharacterized protein n=1 Tax=Mucilaginibacter mallensis TaxID=652787 RepID=A0A1H1QT77_MUCMA|nr:hypothetical protein [Mucilaginibacter mallensis]SDS26523.1 hypothetical protein SAMN05216490_0843 [Mucilaginibacter mallensis]
MLQSTNLEIPESDKEKPANKAKYITAAYNVIGIIVGLIGLFSDKDKNGLIALLMYPILGIVLVLFGKGGIKLISDDKSRIYGSINIGFLITSLFVFLKSLDDYTLFQTTNLWLPFIIISIIILSALYIVGINPFVGKIRIDAIFITAIGLMYAYGSTRQINCAFDYSYPKSYNAIILGHREHRGKHDAWYLTLTPWGPMPQVREEEIDGWLYDHTSIGDTVKVNFKQGLLHIPWFVVTKN